MAAPSLQTEKYFPTWIVEEDHLAIQSAVATYEEMFEEKVDSVGNWVFSTNGVSVAGMFGIPCVGFGPGEERHAHSTEDQVKVEQLVQSAAFYAAFPSMYMAGKRKG